MTPKRHQALLDSGCRTVSDLLYWVPVRYEDAPQEVQLNNVSDKKGRISTIAKVESTRSEGFGNRKRFIVAFGNNGKRIDAVWFKGVAWAEKTFKLGQWYELTGTVGSWRGHLQMVHPQTKPVLGPLSATPMAVNSRDSQQIIPIYPSTAALKSARISNQLLWEWIQSLVLTHPPKEFIPQSLLASLSLPTVDEALRKIHTPEKHGEWESGLDRMRFGELFLFELAVMKLRGRTRSREAGLRIDGAGDHTRAFIASLPFELTDGQRSSLREIYSDMKSGYQMNRLLQGDVGAGKTVVAIATMLMAIDSGFQATMMAPTEILAEQHYTTLKKWLDPLEISVRLLTGSRNSKQRREILDEIASGRQSVLVGTHAILEPEVVFSNLGVVIIDEQHRFGVMQRARLMEKSIYPHMLIMSATPIPRSLALTLYGELDVSIIKGLPSGRMPIKTAVRNDYQRDDVYMFIDEILKDGGQVYVVYPLIEESEALDLKNATAGFEQLRDRFSGARVGLIHGRIKSAEKDSIMKLFSDGELDILVSTTVIEVGVDVPNANVMIVEHAERFGLSQLHQLRGRIGRGSRQSYCILMADFIRSADAKERLATMERTQDGFEIAEADLKLRGPGDFLGTKQSGLPEFKYADIVRDQNLLEQAKDHAERVIHDDPDLILPEHRLLKREFEPYLVEKMSFFQKS